MLQFQLSIALKVYSSQQKRQFLRGSCAIAPLSCSDTHVHTVSVVGDRQGLALAQPALTFPICATVAVLTDQTR